MQTNCILSAPMLISLRVWLCMLSVFMCFIKMLSSSLNTMLIVDEHCSDVCYDEFPVSQIDRKSKDVQEEWQGTFYLQSVREKTRYLKLCKYQNLWTSNKVKGDKNATCLHFVLYLLNMCRKFEFEFKGGNFFETHKYLQWSPRCAAKIQIQDGGCCHF